MGGQNELPQKVPLCHVDYFQLKTMGAQQTQEGASQVALAVKNPPANAGDVRDAGLILGLGKSPGEGMATHCSILAWRIPMDRGAWWATVHRVAKSHTSLM